MALFASIIGGVAGYGTGALMPLVLVPMVGAEPVVPMIAISALLTNAAARWRFAATSTGGAPRIVLVGRDPDLHARRLGLHEAHRAGAMLVIGTMLMATVPLRMAVMRRRGVRSRDGGLAAAACGYGAAVGGTVGAGVILLSILMAAGLEGARGGRNRRGDLDRDRDRQARGVRRRRRGHRAGAGVRAADRRVALPGAFLARALVERLPLHVHTAILDAVVLIGGGVMVVGAFTR